MQKFLLPYFLFSLLMVLVSCKSFKLEDSKPAFNNKTEVKNLYFSSKDIDYLYRGKITAYGNTISGLMVIKKISNTFHRVVMTTDFGNKLLDFEISEHAFNIHYIIPDLDREIVKKILERDFRMLLKENFLIEDAFENRNHLIYTSLNGLEKYYLFYKQSTGILEKIVFTHKEREKLTFTYEGKNPIFADSIAIKHKDIKLNIHLNKISDN